MRRKTPVTKTIEPEPANQKSANTLPEDLVRLKPFMGMRPGVYLAVLYSLVLLLILFFVLLYPGIANPGSMVVFSSEPAGAALRVDGVYAGSSPCRVFVPKGARVMEVVLPGFGSERVECEIPGRLFASKLFPRRYELNIKLNTNDPIAALALSAAEYAQWSFGGEPTAAWQIPLSLSDGIYRIGAAAAGTGANGIIAASARFAVTRAALRDLVRAKALAGSGGLSPSPLGLARSASEIAAYLSANPNSAAWLAETLPADSAAVLTSSAWYQKQLAGSADLAAAEVLSPPPGETIANAPPLDQVRIGGLLFVGISGGSLVQGDPFPRHLPVDPFMICSTDVPASAYADFVEANPRWHLNQREALEQQGLATGDYLADFGNIAGGAGRPGAGLGAVSWYAAQAYCQWLSGRLPDSLSGWEVRLPAEAEWEFAVKSVQQWGRIGSVFFPDGIWEWCADPYSPLPFLDAPTEAIAAVGSPQRLLRGGSRMNAAGSTGPGTRAFLPSETCSPFVMFRPVIARKATDR